jgi:primosomal protein N'
MSTRPSWVSLNTSRCRSRAGVYAYMCESPAHAKERNLPGLIRELDHNHSKQIVVRLMALDDSITLIIEGLPEDDGEVRLAAFMSQLQNLSATVSRLDRDANNGKAASYFRIAELVANDYVALTQRPGYASEAAWKSEAERPRFIELNGLRFLRPYQKRAIVAIQQTVAKGGDRFLLEMATGTGKTLTSAAIIKLFLRTGNARRVLFLVDRLELEDQALKAFRKVLANDYKSVIYKEMGIKPPATEDFATAKMTPMARSFYATNNKISNGRLKRDLGVELAYPTYREGLEQLWNAGEGRPV